MCIHISDINKVDTASHSMKRSPEPIEQDKAGFLGGGTLELGQTEFPGVGETCKENFGNLQPHGQQHRESRSSLGKISWTWKGRLRGN